MLLVPLIPWVIYYSIAKYAGWKHIELLRYLIPKIWASSLLRLLGVRIEVDGLENLDKYHVGPRVLFSNHNSRLDLYVLLAASPVAFKSFWSTRAHIMSEKFSTLLWVGRVLDLFFVHDKTNEKRTMLEFRKAREFVKRGNTLSLFPEGKFSTDGHIGAFGIACTALAVATHAVVQPVLILGTAEYFEKPRNGASKQNVKVFFMPPQSTDNLVRSDRKWLAQELVARMNERLTVELRSQ